MQTTHDSARSLSTRVDLRSGCVMQAVAKRVVDLASMSSFFADSTACGEILAHEGERLIYEVAVVVPDQTSVKSLAYGITRLYPGKVGVEFHMTKGHFHRDRDAPEVYFCLSGTGGILLMAPDGRSWLEELYPGTIVYVPGACAHRLVNTGNQVLVTLAVYPAAAGHDYESIARYGFSSLVVEENGKPKLMPNPRWVEPVEPSPDISVQERAGGAENCA